MNKLFHGRSLLYVSIALVCIYTVVISVFTKGDVLRAFNSYYLFIAVHILLLYGIISVADYFLQKEKPLIRSVARVFFTVLLILAQLPFVLTYLEKFSYSNEALVWLIETLNLYGFYSHQVASVEVYQLPWIAMLFVIVIKYTKEKNANSIVTNTSSLQSSSTLNSYDNANRYTDASVFTVADGVRAVLKKVQPSPVCTDALSLIKLRTSRRIQTLVIFILTVISLFFANTTRHGTADIFIALFYVLVLLFLLRLVFHFVLFIKDIVSPLPTNTTVLRADTVSNADSTNEAAQSTKTVIASNNYAVEAQKAKRTILKLVLITIVLNIVARSYHSHSLSILTDFALTVFWGGCLVYGLYKLITRDSNRVLSLMIMCLPYLLTTFFDRL